MLIGLSGTKESNLIGPRPRPTITKMTITEIKSNVGINIINNQVWWFCQEGWTWRHQPFEFPCNSVKIAPLPRSFQIHATMLLTNTIILVWFWSHNPELKKKIFHFILQKLVFYVCLNSLHSSALRSGHLCCRFFCDLLGSFLVFVKDSV